MSSERKREVIHDTLTSDLFEPGPKRVPLKGLLVNGGVTTLDTGDVIDPFRYLRYFDALLGIGRKAEIPASALSEQNQRMYDALPASAPQSFSKISRT